MKNLFRAVILKDDLVSFRYTKYEIISIQKTARHFELCTTFILSSITWSIRE
uniref:Uncharacterized protein n=1 Tax=Tetranychus urticae TaxID=32264 RepID=T1KUM8_TETUR